MIIEKLFSPDELKEIHHGLQKYMPTYEDYKAHPFLFKELYGESRCVNSPIVPDVAEAFSKGPTPRLYATSSHTRTTLSTMRLCILSYVLLLNG